MKRLVIILLAILLVSPAAFARQGSPTPRQDSLIARVTVYWARGGRGSDRYTRQHKSATGTRLRSGHCAVDPRRIPYGSKVVFPDGTSLAAVDTGTAVKNRKAARQLGRTPYERNALVIDRFFETKGQALSWARRNPHFMTVRVVPPNNRRVAQPSRVLAGKTSIAASNLTKLASNAPRAIPVTASSTAAGRGALNRISR